MKRHLTLVALLPALALLGGCGLKPPPSTGSAVPREQAARSGTDCRNNADTDSRSNS